MANKKSSKNKKKKKFKLLKKLARGIYFIISKIYNIIDNQTMGCHNFNLYKDFWKEHGIDELK